MTKFFIFCDNQQLTKKVTNKNFEKKYKEITGIDVETSEGYQKEDCFASALISYIDFKNILESDIDRKNIEMVEEIIFWLTVFNEKEIIKRKINRKYCELSEKQIEKILNLKYSGWGKVSKKLICEITTFQNGQNLNILELLRKTNRNFMQIINSSEYEIKYKLSIVNSEEKFELSLDDINELQGSPALKKSIWQSVLIIKEIEKILGEAPYNIYIEFARDDEGRNSKIRTSARIKTLKECYKNLEEITSEYNKENAKLIEQIDKTSNYDLSTEMIYLYFLQNGKCLYTGKPLNINELSATCHIDHIIPRKLIKDDSIENKALVLSRENATKSDNLTLSQEIITKQRGYWLTLKKSGMMGNKKYNSLTRANFDEKDVEGFIARQLVETRQITVHLKNLLQNYYSARKTGTRVETVKAGLSSEFRAETELYKLRELNCFHHAHDAYLSAVLGTFVSAKFGRLNNLRDSLKYKSVLKSNGNYILKSFMNTEAILDEDGVILWENGQEKVEQMRKIFNYRDILVSKKVEEVSGLFYDQNILKKGKGSIPINSRTVGKSEKYGGYSGQNMAMFMLIRFNNGKKFVMRIIGVPIAKRSLMKKGNLSKEQFLKEYFEKNEPTLDYKTAKVLKEFGKYQEIELKGEVYQFASVKEGDSRATLHNSTDLILNDKYKKILFSLYHTNYKSRHDMQNGETLYHKITFNELLELYEIISSKGKERYPLLRSNFEKFDIVDFGSLEESSSKYELEKLIKTLLKGLTRGATRETVEFNFDGKKIKLSAYGSMTPYVKKIEEDVVFINKSVTGLYVKREVVKYEL